MRSLLLHAHDDARFDDRLQVALDLAREFDSHVSCLQAVSYDVVMPGDFYGTVASQMVPVLREQAQEFETRMSERLAGEDVRWDWISDAGLADARLLRYSALSDLVIVSASSPGDEPGPSGLAGSVAIHARAPVLVVPDGVKGVDVDVPALVAWNGSVEASRALRAALPLLTRATQVYLVSVGDDASAGFAELPLLSGASYLSRHGIECEMVTLPDRGVPVGEVLFEAAQARDAGYIVMGAYGHTRLMETLFGGVTRSMLRDPKLPLLIAH